jgi:hypothetical protein
MLENLSIGVCNGSIRGRRLWLDCKRCVVSNNGLEVVASLEESVRL